MKHPERVEDYLDHIVEAITRAESYLEPLAGLEDFEKNPQVQDAVIRNIEIIDEAAARIEQQAPGYVQAHPEIPWSQMRGMRNKRPRHNADHFAFGGSKSQFHFPKSSAEDFVSKVIRSSLREAMRSSVAVKLA